MCTKSDDKSPIPKWFRFEQNQQSNAFVMKMKPIHVPFSNVKTLMDAQLSMLIQFVSSNGVYSYRSLDIFIKLC